jgi:phage terminase Nu1 subunit (DNA packaging protein)
MLCASPATLHLANEQAENHQLCEVASELALIHMVLTQNRIQIRKTVLKVAAS